MSRTGAFSGSDGTHRDKQHPEGPLAAKERVGKIGKGNWKKEENRKTGTEGKGRHEFSR